MAFWSSCLLPAIVRPRHSLGFNIWLAGSQTDNVLPPSLRAEKQEMAFQKRRGPSIQDKEYMHEW